MPISKLSVVARAARAQALPCRRPRASRGAALLLAWLCAAVARAQPQPDAGARPQPQPASSGRSKAGVPAAEPSAAQPPRVLQLAPAVVEHALALQHGGSLELVVRVDAQGRATLDQDLPNPALRRAVQAALARARFEPARVGGIAVPARARVRLRLVEPAPPAPLAATPAPSPSAQRPALALAPAAPPLPAPAAAEPYVFGATGRVNQPRPNQHHLESEVTRDLPGAFGDPFRAIDSMPGVVPAVSGLPYVYVRGAPPSGTVYYYDDIQVPALFHLALGPAVVHPAMIGNVDFYPSVAPARYGRATGGVLASESCTAPCVLAPRGELELRAIDVMGMAATPLGRGGSVSVAGRYGYPGLLLSALSPNIELQYWDYQTRLQLPLGGPDRFELSWFGSYDHEADTSSNVPGSGIDLQFHRAEARVIRTLDSLELGGMLQLGYERSTLKNEFGVSAFRLGPRAYLSWHDARGLRLRVGGDFFGIVGSLRDLNPGDQNNLDFVDPGYRSAPTRSLGGLYGELHLPLAARWDLDAGLRGDVWITGRSAQQALEPRATVTFRPLQRLSLHAAVGLGDQPAVFLIPLPGVADVALDHGLQRAIQSEAGAALELGQGLHLQSQLYLQRFFNMILPEAVLTAERTCGLLPLAADGVFGCDRQSSPRSSVWAYGLELFLRRDVSKALSGWLSYTLGWADARSEQGQAYRPSFDIRHVVNLVLQYRLPAGFSLGGRLFYRSGKVVTYDFVRAQPISYQQRLPGFFRGDAELAYSWTTSWARLRLALEWLNVTLSREAVDIACHDGVQTGKNPLSATPCTVRYAPAIFFPSLGLRARFE